MKPGASSPPVWAAGCVPKSAQCLEGLQLCLSWLELGVPRGSPFLQGTTRGTHKQPYQAGACASSASCQRGTVGALTGGTQLGPSTVPIEFPPPCLSLTSLSLNPRHHTPFELLPAVALVLLVGRVHHSVSPAQSLPLSVVTAALAKPCTSRALQSLPASAYPQRS